MMPNTTFTMANPSMGVLLLLTATAIASEPATIRQH